MKKFNKPFWEEIDFKNIKDNDIIYLSYENKSSYDHFRIINNKWFNIFENKFVDYFKPNKKNNFKFFKQNYKFISRPDEWFIVGTEAYLESEVWGDEESGYSALFRGWYYDEKTGKTGEDGETCPFDEFDIFEL